MVPDLTHSVAEHHLPALPPAEQQNQHGRALFGSMGNPMTTDPIAIGNEGGVANTNIVWHAGHLLALEEGHHPFEMGPRTLESKGYVRPYGGRVTAHPKIDPVSGEMIWFGYGVGEMPLSAGMSYGITAADGTVTRRQDFQAPYSSMVHDFMVTENHALFPVLPLTGSLERAMGGRPPFAWEPEKGSFVGVMRRDADVSTIRWFNTEACYVFHPLNSWEEGGKIFCDVMRYNVAPLFPNADGSEPQAGELTTYWAKARMRSGRVRSVELKHADPRLGVLHVITELAREVGLSVNVEVKKR